MIPAAGACCPTGQECSRKILDQRFRVGSTLLKMDRFHPFLPLHPIILV